MIRPTTIRHKLTLLISSAVGLGLLLTFLLFTIRDIEQRREAKLTELYSMAEVIAFNASAVWIGTAAVIQEVSLYAAR